MKKTKELNLPISTGSLALVIRNDSSIANYHKLFERFEDGTRYRRIQTNRSTMNEFKGAGFSISRSVDELVREIDRVLAFKPDRFYVERSG